jgi:hypothetical protein
LVPVRPSAFRQLGSGVISNALRYPTPVIPAKAGIQCMESGYLKVCGVDSRFRGNDAVWRARLSRMTLLPATSVARLTPLYIGRPRSPAPERGPAVGGFQLPGDVKFKARVAPVGLARPPAPFDLQIPVRFRIRSSFLATFFEFVWPFLHSRTSSFLAFLKVKSFVCNRWLGSFRQKTSFFRIRAFFPLAGSIPRSHAAPCRRSLATTLIGYSELLVMSREICRRQKVR